MVKLKRRREPRTAFVLSGGGNLGALQVGMLRALAQAGEVPDVVLGCSVGSLNGAAFARNPTPAGVSVLAEAWKAIESPSLMPSSWVPSAIQLLRKGASLHDSDGLHATAEALLGAETTIESLSLPFQCVATSVDTAMEHWFDSGELLPAIMASAALPAVYPPVEIDGRRYVDGGVVDNVPIARAVELGCDRIFVLHVGLHGRPDTDVRRPLDGALLAYWLARNSRFVRDLAALPDGVEAIVLPVGQRPDLRYDDFSETATLIDQGRELTETFLAEREAERATTSGDLPPKSLARRFRRLRLPRAGSRTHEAELAADSAEGAVVLGWDPGTEADDDRDQPGAPEPGEG
ncbi:MAG: patatin-like phospholipase family protein [Microthrixaceae bacterium]